jgi:hypothetical protein
VTLRYHTLGDVIDVVEAAMMRRYGRKVAPLATAWLIEMCQAEPCIEGEA